MKLWVILISFIIFLLCFSVLFKQYVTIEHFQIIPIYIISLPSRKETRLDPLLSKIKDDSRYTIRSIVGVDGMAVVEGFLKKGEIGCWLSHIEVWRQISVQSEPYALVLEDDAMVDFPQMLPQMLTIINEMPKEWDICYLGGRYADKERRINKISEHVVSSSSRMWHAHAYLITRTATQKLLYQSKDFNKSKDVKTFENILPVDDWMTNYDRNLLVFNAHPVLIDFKFDNVSDTKTT